MCSFAMIDPRASGFVDFVKFAPVSDSLFIFSVFTRLDSILASFLPLGFADLS